MGKSINRFAVLFLMSLSVFLFSTYAFCQQSPLINSGIEQYRNGEYEEAINTFTKARNENPKSTEAAFFLGMAYKQTMDYDKRMEAYLAMEQLSIDEAVVAPLYYDVYLYMVKPYVKNVDWIPTQYGYLKMGKARIER